MVSNKWTSITPEEFLHKIPTKYEKSVVSHLFCAAVVSLWLNQPIQKHRSSCWKIRNITFHVLLLFQPADVRLYIPERDPGLAGRQRAAVPADPGRAHAGAAHCTVHATTRFANNYWTKRCKSFPWWNTLWKSSEMCKWSIANIV